MSTDVSVRSSVSVSLRITNLVELREFCEILAKTSMVPKAYVGKADDILVAMLHGQEVGLPHLQALQSIATVNGIPSVYGDAALALVRASGQLADLDEWFEVDGVRQSGSSFSIQKWAEEGKTIVACCLTLRTGASRPRLTTFSVDDSKRAGLWGRVSATGVPSPWVTHPQRMLMFRARGWNLRDQFGDVLKGLAIYEEARDVATEIGEDGAYRPALPVAATDAGEASSSEKKAADVLGKMKRPTPATAHERAAETAYPNRDVSPPVPGASSSLDAAYLSQVLDCEDFLRGTQQGKGSLQSMRRGFKLEDGAYPMLAEDQANYLSDLKRTVERMQAA